MLEMTKWRPFERLFPAFPASTFGDMTRDDFLSRWLHGAGNGDDWAPRVDLRETEKTYEVEGELPGVSPDDIEVSLNNGCLTIRGEKRQEERREDENLHVYERSYGSFSRSFMLPAPVLEDSVSAESIDGLLKVTVEKKEKTKPVKIQVKGKRG
jgi:HSP20 family protein